MSGNHGQLRVLQVITDPTRRGAQLFALDLAGALADSDVAVRTLALGPAAREPALEVPVLGGRRLAWSTITSLRREVARVDVTVAHGGQTLPACALATAGTRKPFVYRQISSSLFWASSPIRRMRVRVGLARAARVVALWKGAAETLQQHFGVRHDHIRVIPNAVVPGRFSPVGANRREEARRRYELRTGVFTLVAAGALVADKGVDLVIEAVGQTPNVQLLVAGDGPEQGRLHALAGRVAPGRVAFAGAIDDVATALSAGDAVVLASRGGDSMPAVLIEAGLMGLPAIATPVEAIPEIVVPGITGDLVPVGDVDALANAVARLAAAPDKAAELGRRARRHSLERFSIEPVAREWEMVLRDAAGMAR